MECRSYTVLVMCLWLSMAFAGCDDDPPASPCDGVTCSFHGTCVVESGTARCDCDEGYETDGLACTASADGDADSDADGDGDGDGDTDADGDGDGDADADGDSDADGDATFCLESCWIDDHCELGGDDIGFNCNTTTNRCESAVPTDECTSATECLIAFNGWTDLDGTPCTMDRPRDPIACPGGEVCCQLGRTRCIEGGICAAAPHDTVDCEDLSMVEVQVPKVGTGDPVTVCVTPGTEDAVCDDGSCRNPCEAHTDCGGTTPLCDTGSGQCVCATEPADSCTGATTGGTVCQANGACGCATVDDCAGETPFDGTVWVCEGA